MSTESAAQMADWAEEQQKASTAALQAKFKATNAVGARISAAIEGKEIESTRRTIQELVAILSETSKNMNASVQPEGWKPGSLMNMVGMYLREADTAGQRRRRNGNNKGYFEYPLAVQLRVAERTVAHYGRSQDSSERVSWLARATAALKI